LIQGRIESAFTKKPGTHLFVEWQVGPAKDVVGNPRGILGDPWQGLRPQCHCFRRSILKERAHPFFDFMARMKTPPMQFSVAVTCGIPIRIVR
jgi:hypothetical protein